MVSWTKGLVKLKGVFAKNSMVIATMILLLSIAAIRRKWLNTTHTEERSVNT